MQIITIEQIMQLFADRAHWVNEFLGIFLTAIGKNITSLYSITLHYVAAQELVHAFASIFGLLGMAYIGYRLALAKSSRS